jgi:hypothetical protein
MTAAGKKRGPRLITLTAMILAEIRQVTKIALTITNNCETFMLNPVYAVERTQGIYNPIRNITA